MFFIVSMAYIITYDRYMDYNILVYINNISLQPLPKWYIHAIVLIKYHA